MSSLFKLASLLAMYFGIFSIFDVLMHLKVVLRSRKSACRFLGHYLQNNSSIRGFLGGIEISDWLYKRRRDFLD